MKEKEAEKNVSDQTEDSSLDNSSEEKVAPVKKRKRPVKATADKENLTNNDEGATQPVLETSNLKNQKKTKRGGGGLELNYLIWIIIKKLPKINLFKFMRL